MVENAQILSMLEEFVKGTQSEVKNLRISVDDMNKCLARMENSHNLLSQKIETCQAEKSFCHKTFADHEARTRELERCAGGLTEKDVNKLVSSHPVLQNLIRKVYIGTGIAITLSVVVPIFLNMVKLYSSSGG